MKEWIITTTYLDKFKTSYGAFSEESPISKLDDFFDTLFVENYSRLGNDIEYEDEDMSPDELEEERYLEYVNNWAVSISEGDTENLEIIYDERK